MLALGKYILRGRMQAIGVISLLTIMSLLLPPLAYLVGGVPVGLVTLRRGAVIGIQVVTGSLLFTGLLTVLVNLNQTLAIAFALGIWLPVWVCSLILRMTRSQGLLVLAAGVFGLLFVVLMYQFTGDVTAWWRSWLDTWLEGNFPAGTSQQYRELFEPAVPLMNAMMASGIVVSLVLTTLIARWWQASLFNPGGFREEFYALRLPRWMALPTLVGVILLLLGNDTIFPVLRDALIIIVFLYLFQGISTIHRTVKLRKLSHAWLVGMYGLLLIVPQMVLFIACVGMADAWLGGRNKHMGDNNRS